MFAFRFSTDKEVQKEKVLDIPALLEIDMATVRILWGFSRALIGSCKPWKQVSAMEKKLFMESLDRLVLARQSKNDRVMYAALLALMEEV